MTTVSTTTPSAELHKLEQKREKAYAALQKVKRDREAYDAETAQLRADYTQHRHVYPEQYEGSTFRPKGGSEAAELEQALKKRLRDPNPQQEAYDKARAAFHAADVPYEDFKRQNVHGRIAETEADAKRAIEKMKAGAETQLEGCREYRGVADAVRDVALSTAGLSGQHAGFDARVNEVERWATQTLEADIRSPGLTDVGQRRAEKMPPPDSAEELMKMAAQLRAEQSRNPRPTQSRSRRSSPSNRRPSRSLRRTWNGRRGCSAQSRSTSGWWARFTRRTRTHDRPPGLRHLWSSLPGELLLRAQAQAVGSQHAPGADGHVGRCLGDGTSPGARPGPGLLLLV
ncbi:MAG TPA: hypothetical protein VFY37_02115 [Solirubrobacterales bacterium]|nr:hypothetical protein [Solirubrobacterales bacterium]